MSIVKDKLNSVGLKAASLVVLASAALPACAKEGSSFEYCTSNLLTPSHGESFANPAVASEYFKSRESGAQRLSTARDIDILVPGQAYLERVQSPRNYPGVGIWKLTLLEGDYQEILKEGCDLTATAGMVIDDRYFDLPPVRILRSRAENVGINGQDGTQAYVVEFAGPDFFDGVDEIVISISFGELGRDVDHRMYIVPIHQEPIASGGPRNAA